MFISVIIPTYNPDQSRLIKSLQGLKEQSFPLNEWELIIVDNNSAPPVELNLSWHPNHQIIHEPEQGLTYARIAGFNHAKGNIVIMVDDDNILHRDYLQNAMDIFLSNPDLGAIGGRSIPLFENTPPFWLQEFYSALALRDMGESVITTGWENLYPDCAPIGAGMCLKMEALGTYMHKISNGNKIITDRTASSLASGGDNDIVIEILRSGWRVGYFPTLYLQHIIPVQRMQTGYLARLLYSTNKSWVQLLENQGINPWAKMNKIAAWLRKMKGWFAYAAWKNPVQYIKWRGACGHFDGLADYK
ncbi:glycosyltransferase [Mucilaginibacter rigui]|uniref:Glycosyltransferase n=1 Tax=Mucilaginibacter rigui TaxID=534635 RepID=A0ABR7X9F5_9SPHI|nr:glycosyltransferase family 2 protein [Mucilaginibacter rigui]MBD1386765.1 glycosyltransferase [Mucilaginibacter rigui]